MSRQWFEWIIKKYSNYSLFILWYNELVVRCVLRSQEEGRLSQPSFLNIPYQGGENGLETKRDFIWKMERPWGQSVESCGEILGKVLAQEGYSLFSQRLFRFPYQGWHTAVTLRIATRNRDHWRHVNCLVALDRNDRYPWQGSAGRRAMSPMRSAEFEAHTGRMFLALPITGWQRNTAACR